MVREFIWLVPVETPLYDELGASYAIPTCRGKYANFGSSFHRSLICRSPCRGSLSHISGLRCSRSGSRADVGDGDDDAGTSFEEQILKLVLATLAGKDVEKAAQLSEKSIEDAKTELEREENTISEMLGSMGGAEYVGPRAPILPDIPRSMEPRDFTLKALDALGVHVTAEPNGLYLAEENGGREYIRFEFEFSGLFPVVRYEATRKHARATERIIMAACNGEQIDQRVEIPKAILNWRRGQH